MLLFSIWNVAAAQKLPRYSCNTHHFEPDLWMKQYQRKLDHNGVVTQKGQYHPLSIAFYGIMNYDQYMVAEDTAVYRRILNQYSYFSRDTNLTWIDDRKGVGLPYRTAFKDLKAPWYSGMTQGVAISFVLRYYCLTKDPEAKEFAKKLAYFMLRPVKDGGAIGKTPEGKLWIEEYPNSKQSQQVLNGFINGLIGLYEYTLFFPEDTAAKRIHDSTYLAMISSFPLYDTHEWTNYNRNATGVTNQYMRYQLTELDHLYEIYKDPRLVRQMKIWAFFAHQKLDKELKFYKNPIYQFGMKMNPDGTWDKVQDSLFFARSFQRNTKMDVGRRYRTVSLPWEWKRNKKLYLRTPQPTTYVILHLDTLYRNFQIQGVGEDLDKHPVRLEFTSQGNSVHIQSCTPFSKVQISARATTFHNNKIEGIEFHNADNIMTPKFLFDTLRVAVELKKGVPYKVEYEAQNLCDLTIFYKYASQDGLAMKRAKWRADQFIEDPTVPFVPPADGIYKFFYSFQYLRPNPSFKHFKVQAMN